MTVLHITTSRLGGFANMVIYGRRTIKIVIKEKINSGAYITSNSKHNKVFFTKISFFFNKCIYRLTNRKSKVKSIFLGTYW